MMRQYERKTVPVGESEMSYAVFGTGAKPFVILPGLSVRNVTLSAGSVAAAFADFCEKYTVWLFDRPEKVPQGTTLADLAEATATAMQTLGIAHTDIFGASQGGMLAMILAARHPELADTLILGSTAARDTATFRAVRSRWIAAAEAGDCPALAAAFADDLYGDAFLEKYRHILLGLADYTPAELARFVTLCRACDSMDADIAPQKITARCLVLGCEGDKVLTPAESRYLARVLCCEAYFYPDSFGHAVYDEAPDYRARMLAFLTQS